MKSEATEAQLIAVMAACFAVSNFGMWSYIERVEDRLDRMILKNDHMVDARYAVCELAGFLMENEEHEEMFSQEAESWERSIKKVGLRAFIIKWEKHNAWLSKFQSAITW